MRERRIYSGYACKSREKKKRENQNKRHTTRMEMKSNTQNKYTYSLYTNSVFTYPVRLEILLPLYYLPAFMKAPVSQHITLRRVRGWRFIYRSMRYTHTRLSNQRTRSALKTHLSSHYVVDFKAVQPKSIQHCRNYICELLNFY